MNDTPIRGGAVLSMIAERGGRELAERLDALERTYRGGVRRGPKTPPPRAPRETVATDFDVALAGGGLSLLIAPLLAASGARVAVFDRGRAGTVHREWNAGIREIDALRETGLFSPEQLDRLVVARYRHGICRWHRGGTYPVEGVLDHAIDAKSLLHQTRELSEACGVALHDGHELTAEAAGPGGVAMRFETASGPATATAKVLIDARGASSPYASADLVCPTVGGVLEGLEQGDAPDEIDPAVGEILVTTEDVEEGRQHIWEAFPVGGNRTTVYLFYYARADAVGARPLMSLYSRFFETLSRFKRGGANLVRPTFGFIPGWSRLTAPPKPPSSRVFLFGDVAARHSPLTYCGFGSLLRGLAPAARRVLRFLDTGGGALQEDLPIHTGTGALSMLMATPPRAPARRGEINDLLDAAFATLHAMGNETYAALLRDEMHPKAFMDFLRRTAAHRPRVYRDVVRSLGPFTTGRWGLRLLRQSLTS
jgi:lycopene cyclase CruA